MSGVAGSGRNEAMSLTSVGPHRDDVLLGKLLRVRARLGLIHHAPQAGPGSNPTRFPTEIRLLDEVIEELPNDV